MRSGPDLDLSPPVRLDLWAILVAAGITVGTVASPLAPVLLVAAFIVAIGALIWRDLVPAEWRLMAVLAPLFAAGGVTIALLHAATPDPLAELAAMEPGEVVLVGRIASPPEESGFGYMADLRVERLWYEGREVLRGGGVEVFAGDLSIGVGDRVPMMFCGGRCRRVATTCGLGIYVQFPSGTTKVTPPQTTFANDASTERWSVKRPGGLTGGENPYRQVSPRP